MRTSLNKFEGPNGVVGLRIVAAMNKECPRDPIFCKNKAPFLVVSPRETKAIPVFSQRNDFYVKKDGKRPSFEEMEMCEEYTCVISHVGNNLVKKRVYFDDDFLGVSEGSGDKFAGSVGGGGSGGVGGGGGGDAAAGWTADFLSSCFLCKKKLDGLDIFMYRGEKGFCSAECRDKHICFDDHKDKCVSGVMNPSEYSASPCSGPMQVFAGVAAA